MKIKHIWNHHLVLYWSPTKNVVTGTLGVAPVISTKAHGFSKDHLRHPDVPNSTSAAASMSCGKTPVPWFPAFFQWNNVLLGDRCDHLSISFLELQGNGTQLVKNFLQLQKICCCWDSQSPSEEYHRTSWYFVRRIFTYPYSRNLTWSDTYFGGNIMKCDIFPKLNIKAPVFLWFSSILDGYRSSSHHSLKQGEILTHWLRGSN